MARRRRFLKDSVRTCFMSTGPDTRPAYIPWTIRPKSLEQDYTTSDVSDSLHPHSILVIKFTSRASFRLSATTAARPDVPDSNMTKHPSKNVLGKYLCLVCCNAERIDSRRDWFFSTSLLILSGYRTTDRGMWLETIAFAGLESDDYRVNG
ncbi:hypothetical protein PGT21_012359 [Puccinia graminis f. sp. tritici]|uniref:Uncharacterized protein n=1 Tax=Puccinia graminis f. sp. tritici TaxID=56615 RepID=A0A5B0NRF8_PUCGR|nr:hypothetical protein PGTUg99_005036 [Puccinia graminis f. sp. tritici]KAA1090740.1 hypothetical protein PGT21_012359 [Puccinia graminis f. sp. tritici]